MADVPLLSRLATAAVRPLHLLPAGVGAVTAGGLVFLGLPPLALAVGALSIGAWGALVAWDLASAKPAHGRLGTSALETLLEEVRSSAGRITDRIDAHEGVLAPSLLDRGARES